MAERYLARFRADPKKIRVSVRRFTDAVAGVYWLASFDHLATGSYVSMRGKTAVRALVGAFRLAKEANMKGLDPHMMWSYDHPQGALAPRSRASRVFE